MTRWPSRLILIFCCSPFAKLNKGVIMGLRQINVGDHTVFDGDHNE